MVRKASRASKKPPHLNRLQLELDHRLKVIAKAARILPALTTRHAPAERARLIDALDRGDHDALVPAFECERRVMAASVWTALEEARQLAEACLAPSLYLARLDELELELTLIEVLGDPALVKPIARRLFGSGSDETSCGRLSDVAARLLANIPHAPNNTEQHLAPDEMRALLLSFAQAARLRIEVEVVPNLVSNAAAGERTAYISPRSLGRREALRLGVHEVLAHLVAAANARAQRLMIFRVGTAGSFGDQEGLALVLEERSGLMDTRRVRTIAARVWVTDRLHDGADFRSVVLQLTRDYGFSAVDAVALGERAFRGGGFARDVVYLRGWLRVRKAIASGETSVDEMRSGRVAVADLGARKKLGQQGYMGPLNYRPSLERSLAATGFGTNSWTSPPNLAASLMSLDDT